MVISWRTVYQNELNGRELEVRRSSEGAYQVLTHQPEPALAWDDAEAANSEEWSPGEALNRDGLAEALLERRFSPSEVASVIATLSR